MEKIYNDFRTISDCGEDSIEGDHPLSNELTLPKKQNDVERTNMVYGSIVTTTSEEKKISSDEAHQMYNRLGEIMPIKTYRDDILSTAHSLCDAFANKAPLNEVLDQFSTSDEVFCLEHGLQRLAPFLGRIFVGQEG
eukprot:3754239-Ditylum_brightwellii.AAC.1